MGQLSKEAPKTAKEFNDKYKKFLEPGFEDQGLEFGGIESLKFLDNVFKDLTRIPGFHYSQIKWKFNSVRFYSSLKSREISAWIEETLRKLDGK